MMRLYESEPHRSMILVLPKINSKSKKEISHYSVSLKCNGFSFLER